MKRILLLLLVVVFTKGLVAQQDSLSHNLEDFHALVVFGNIKVHLVRGKENNIRLRSGSYDLSKVSTYVSKGVLMLKSKAIGDEKEVVAVLTYRQLDNIKADAGANIVDSDTLRATTLTIKAVKGSLMRLKIAAQNVNITVTQGSEVRASGYATLLVAKGGSGALLDAYALRCDEAELNSNTGANLKATVKERLRAKAVSGGVINYKGHPKKESVQSSLGGEINKL